MKDIMQKLAELEATAPKVTKKKMLNEDSTTPPMNVSNKPASLKDVFASLSENIAPGQKPIPVLDPQNKQAGMGFVTSDNPSIQNILKGLDPKEVQIVQAPGQQPVGQQQQRTGQSAQPAQAPAAGQSNPNQMQAGQQAMQEESFSGGSKEDLAKEMYFVASKIIGYENRSARVPENFWQQYNNLRATWEKTYGELDSKDIINDAFRLGEYAHWVKDKGAQQKAELGDKLTYQVRQDEGGKWIVFDTQFNKPYSPGKDDKNKVEILAAKLNSTQPKQSAPAAPAQPQQKSFMGRVADKAKQAIGMKEEQLDEISSDLATRYLSKAASSRENDKANSNLPMKKRDNRMAGANLAREKIRAGQDKDSGARVGTNEGAKVDRMVKHIEKSEKKLGKSKGEAEDIAWATANKRGMLDNKNKKKVKEGDIAPTSSIDTKGAGLGAGRSATTLEGKKPDFLDLDKDGNKKEPMKKAAADKKKKKVDESMNHRISAARLEGKSHGLRGHAHSGKRYEDLDEMKAYHEGYKDGMDELHEMGMYETAPAATVPGMATQALDEGGASQYSPEMHERIKNATPKELSAMAQNFAGDPMSYQYEYDMLVKAQKELRGEMEEGNAFTAALAKTPKGGKFSVGGKTFTDRTNYDTKVDEYAFESANLDEAIGNPIGAVARELRGLKGIAKDTPYGQMPGAMGAASGAATGIAAAATMGAGAAAFLPIVGAAALGGWGLMKAGQLTGKVLNYLAQKVFGTKEEALEFAKAHLEAARDGEDSFQHNGKTYKVSLKPGQISQLYGDIEQLSKEIKDKDFDKRMAPDTAMGKIGAALKEDPVFESWDKELNSLLNESEEVTEGLSVSISKGQQNSPDSVTITAQDQEAEHLLAFVKNAGLGLFGDDHEHSPSSAMSIQPAHGAPDEVGAGGVDIGVVDGHDGMMGLMQKLTGIQSGGDEDYADEEGDEEQLYGNHAAADEKDCGCDGDCECSDYDKPSKEESCNECGGMMEAGHSCGSKEMVDEVESEDQMEFEVAEDNAPDSGAAETTADENAEAEEDKALALKSVNESFADILARLEKLAEGSGDEPKHAEHDKKDDKDQDDAEEEEEVKESADEEDEDAEDLTEWANNAGKKGTDASFEADIDFMTKVIAGGLNKPKSTGQTTVPVIAGQESRMHDHQGTVSDSVDDWVKLAGIK
jgi:hypothetical protein